MTATLLLIGGAALWAGGAVELQNVPGSIAGNYDYRSELVMPEQVTATYGETGTQNYYIVVAAGSSGDAFNRTLTDGAGNTLSYQFVDSAVTRNIILDNANAQTDQDALIGSFSGPGQQEQPFDVIVPSGQFPPPGQYSDSPRMVVYEGTVGTGSIFSAQFYGPIDVNVTVPSFVQLSLVDAGAPYSAAQVDYMMDFGVLSAGMSRQVDLVVRSNETFGVSLESANGGAMAIQSAGDGSTVPYQLSVDGSPIDLSGGLPVPILDAVGPTDLAGRRYQISVEIQDFGFATDGVYEDAVTVVVTAQ